MEMKFRILGDYGEELDSSALLESASVTLLSRGGTAGTPSSQNQDYPVALRAILQRLELAGRYVTGAWVDSTRVQSLPLTERQISFPDDSSLDPKALFSLMGKRMERVGQAPGSDPEKGNRNKRIRIETSTTSVGELASIIRAKPAADIPRSALRLPAADLRKVTEVHIWAAIETLRAGALSHGFDDSLGYDLVTEDGDRLPPKAVFGVALSAALGFAVQPVNFTGGLGTVCFDTLETAGWDIVKKNSDVSRKAFDGEEPGWAEGSESRRTHSRRERHPGVSKAKKAQLRALHGKLFCEECGMDPMAVFGGIEGEACIEVHHRATEVTNMQAGHVTRLADLECLCANCHRVRHRLMKARETVGLAPPS